VHAAGLALFLALFGHDLDRARPSILAAGRWSSGAGLVAVIVHRSFEPARAAGSFDGLLDGSLHALLWSSDAGATAGVQLLGLAFVALSFKRSSQSARTWGVVGTALIASSFAFMGHTATHEQRWLLGPALIAHVLIVAFWFGALWPLYRVVRNEGSSIAGAAVARFSATALWLVPMIFVAGLVLSVALTSFEALLTPYGVVLLAKIAGFGGLMVPAALNKWRYGPAIGAGHESAARAFGILVRIEWVIIAAVLILASIMTSLFAPMPAAH